MEKHSGTPRLHDWVTVGSGEEHQRFVMMQKPDGNSDTSDSSDTSDASDTCETTASAPEAIPFSETTEVQGSDLHDHLDTSIAELKTRLELISNQLVDMQHHHERRLNGIDATLQKMTEALERLDQRMKAMERETTLEPVARDADM
jgi:flagellar capping protein FliD